MKQHYTIKKFTPSSRTLDIIRQFAHTYRPIVVNGQYMPFYLN